jgi:hypothetical protein
MLVCNALDNALLRASWVQDFLRDFLVCRIGHLARSQDLKKAIAQPHMVLVVCTATAVAANYLPQFQTFLCEFILFLFCVLIVRHY